MTQPCEYVEEIIESKVLVSQLNSYVCKIDAKINDMQEQIRSVETIQNKIHDSQQEIDSKINNNHKMIEIKIEQNHSVIEKMLKLEIECLKKENISATAKLLALGAALGIALLAAIIK